MPSDFNWTVRIYYEDTDAGGVVYYANYLKFFERARTEWLRAAGIGQQALAESHGMMFIVKSIAIDYHAPAKLDDELKLTLAVEKLGAASAHLVQQAWRITGREEELLATGRIKIGSVDTALCRPIAMPDVVRAKIPGNSPQDSP